ncbi:MAG: monovalent cation/H(+) antiporter subunit G [Thermoleophilia bacterium]
MLSGVFFLAVAVIGILRLPDFYTRVHAVGKGDTLGAMLVLTGLALYNGFELNSAKLLLMLGFVALANPAAAHALSRAALRSGLEPHTGPDEPESPGDSEWHPIRPHEPLRRVEDTT